MLDLNIPALLYFLRLFVLYRLILCVTAGGLHCSSVPGAAPVSRTV
jgi:hypothetical protein